MNNKLLLVLLFTICLCNAQEKIEFIDINKISSLALDKANEGDYDKSIEFLNKISKNDSSYCASLVNKSHYLFLSKKFKEAVEVCNEGLALDCFEKNSIFYINKGVSLISLKEYSKGLNVLNEGLNIYPNNHKLWYNKGVVFENLNNIPKAIEAYQKSMIFNPTFRSPHLKLGNICYKQGRMAQALMCFNMYLVLEPDGEGAFDVLKSLNNAVESKNINEPNDELEISSDDYLFDEIDLVLNNKLALNDDYKVDSKITISLVKQNHALIEQLKEIEVDNGFWSTKYIPFYQWIAENDYFDVFTYTTSYSIKNEKFKKIVDDHTKDIISFMELSSSKWKELLSKNTILIDGKEHVKTFNFGTYVHTIGKMENDNMVGDWNYYNSQGQLSTKGRYNDKGQEIGHWVWYNTRGNISESVNYSNGKLEGTYLSFYENGKQSVVSNYVDGVLDGEYKYYNNQGALMHKKYFKNGELDSIYKSYFSVGEEMLEFYIPYKKGVIKDSLTEYFANGSIYKESKYIDGVKDGVEKIYFIDGTLNYKANYTDGKLTGDYKLFYINGKIKEQGTYLDGAIEGNWKTYFKNGKIESESFYAKGILEGLYKYYDDDGILYYEYNYRKGDIIAYTFYDKLGEIIKEGKKKAGEFYYTGFSPYGNMTIEGLYDVSGGKEGEWKYYDSNGVKTSIENFVNQKLSGEVNAFFKNGNLKSKSYYKNDSLTGYYEEYHLSKKLKTQGWYKDSEQHGAWKTYYIDGTLESLLHYHRGELHGNQTYFGVEGKLSSTSLYKYGELMSDTYYNEGGIVYQKVNYQAKENKYNLTFNHMNNEVGIDISYVNGVKHGKYSSFYFNGETKVNGAYLNGQKVGDWLWYNEFGIVTSTANYINNQINGESLDYYNDGVLESNYFYEHGSVEGIAYLYHNNGEIRKISHYQNDVLEGRMEFYSPTGKLQMIRFYDGGKLIGYSYLDRESNELPMIKITKETVKIVCYYDNGKVSREFEIMNGDFIGDYKTYYFSGILRRESPYNSDEINGFEIEYYPNGNVKEKSSYLFGELHGKSLKFYENGSRKEELNYLNNAKSGLAKYYNEGGELIKQEVYFNDEINEIENFVQ